MFWPLVSLLFPLLGALVTLRKAHGKPTFEGIKWQNWPSSGKKRERKRRFTKSYVCAFVTRTGIFPRRIMLGEKRIILSTSRRMKKEKKFFPSRKIRRPHTYLSMHLKCLLKSQKNGVLLRLCGAYTHFFAFGKIKNRRKRNYSPKLHIFANL